MKDSGFPVPRWAFLAPAAAPPILTVDEPILELIPRISPTDSHNDSVPQLGQPIGDMCFPEGQWNCMTTSWQRCASGMWSAIVPCATGTICQPPGLTEYISIEHEPTANTCDDDGDDGRAGGDHRRDGKKSFGLQSSPSLMLLFAALATGISWGFLM
ncbi:hypothetical protein V8C37DRAFT_386375 [Trichoderma ceciliae]